MATISNTPRPGYVWDSTDNVWYPIGVGGHSHPDYITQATAISPTTVDAKGDLLVGSAADTISRLAVGADGSSIVADSSAATGLSYQENYAAGKNKIINGDFNINQRGFTSITTTDTYGFDRWTNAISGGGTVTFTPQTFTPGSAPVAGYESTNFCRVVTTGQTSATVITRWEQRIEDVRTFAGQTMTLSFWAKAASGTPKITYEYTRTYGSGGSTADNNYGGQVTISTSWARYSITVAVPSVSGKTIGTGSTFTIRLWVSAGSDFNARTNSMGIQSNTFDIWGVQAEDGSVATAFQTATGTLQGELAACQRYYYQIGPGSAYASFGVGGFHDSTTAFMFVINTPVVMRTVPTFTTLGSFQTNGTGITLTGLGFNTTYPNVASYNGQASCSGATTGYGSTIRNINDTTAKMMFSSEL